MSHFRTQTMKITRETHPVAVALLAAGFATIPFKKVDGCYVVINTPARRHFSKDPRPTLVLENCWLSARMFEEDYKFLGKPKTNQFTDVEKID